MNTDMKKAVLALAETVKREERRRHRDIQAAIDDLEDAPDGREFEEAIALLLAEKQAGERYLHQIADSTAKVIQDLTGKDLRELIESADYQGFGFDLNPGGEPEAILVDNDGDKVEIPSANEGFEGIDLEGTAPEPQIRPFSVGDRVKVKEGELNQPSMPFEQGIVIAFADGEHRVEVVWNDDPDTRSTIDESSLEAVNPNDRSNA